MLHGFRYITSSFTISKLRCHEKGRLWLRGVEVPYGGIAFA